MLDGRKVVGSAQLRERGALLQHGTILLSGDQRTVADVTRGAAPPDLAGGLALALGERPDPAAVADAVAAAAAARWPGRWGRTVGDQGPLADAAPLEAAVPLGGLDLGALSRRARLPPLSRRSLHSFHPHRIARPGASVTRSRCPRHSCCSRSSRSCRPRRSGRRAAS